MKIRGSRAARIGFGAVVACAAFSLVACAPPAAGERAPVEDDFERVVQDDETPEGFDLDALVDAAKQEGPITIYDESGKIVQIAEAFTAKYGIPAEGVKIETGAIEKMKRENASGNIVADVLAIADPPTVAVELIEDDIVTSWAPGDRVAEMPELAQFPLLRYADELVWAYNSENQDSCPIDNVWALTDEAWSNKVAVGDWEARNLYTNWLNQAARNHDAEYREAYEEYFGEELETDQPTAVHEWVKRFVENSPNVFKSDTEAGESVGAPGQSDPPMGLMHVAVYRYNVGNYADKGYRVQACDGLKPFAGTEVAQTVVYATKTKNPNAAKLFIHFLLSQEGMDFITPDGKQPYVGDIEMPADEHGFVELRTQLQPYDTAHLSEDFYATESWQDLWRSNRK